MDTTQGDHLYTPRRVQKCLFGSNESSSKKSAHKIHKNLITGDNLSEEESDLGPMSPLALTDQSPSSCSSSPRNSFFSPCMSPKKASSLFNIHVSWDQLSMSARRKSMNDYTPSHSTSMKISQSVRLSPQQKILAGLPKSSSNTPLKNSNFYTPKKLQMSVFADEVVPETPERHFGKELQNNLVETPCNSRSPEHKLITPLTSENKTLIVPKLHRRKSLGIYDINKNSSPKRKENTLKRHAFEELGNTAKLLKTNENCSIPKARAALFQDKNNETRLKNMTLSTKSFYSNSDEKKNYKTMYEVPEQKRQRKIPYNKKATRRYTIGGINGGVSHGIKRPKPKVHVIVSKNSVTSTVKNNMIISTKSDMIDSAQNMSIQKTQNNTSIEKSSSPEIDLNKRFFKTKRIFKKNCSGVVTINNNVKLKVASNDELILNQENVQPSRQMHKRAKLMEVSFDTTDLTVDEPELEATIEQNNVANILKVLEEDWADDDYDIMDTLTNQKIENISPLKQVTILQDVTMSPASELSSMTSIMNITDVNIPVTFENISLDDSKSNVKENEQRYYPIFNKGYSVNKMLDEIGNKSTHSMKENINWQLSVKQNGNEKQYQLDAGQKNFGATQCTECGVVYQIGDPEDENAHLNYHNNKKSLKFPGWKTERVILQDPFTSSRIILVEPSDSKLYWNKVIEILAYINRDLGLIDTKLSDYENKKVYLYIRDKTVLGVLVAERINTAHRMIPELLELDCCTAESTPAKCGINVVWTDINHRKQGIATKLVDVLRSQFYYGYVMSLDDIAFSIPTLSGKIFAEKYTKTRNFKVYS